MNLDMERIGGNIREARKAAGMLQKDLAEKIGVARTVIPGLENARRKSVDIDTLNSIAAATNTPVHVLLGFDVRTLALERIREAAPELATQIEREGVAGLTDKDVRGVVRIILE